MEKEEKGGGRKNMPGKGEKTADGGEVDGGERVSENDRERGELGRRTGSGREI